MKLKLILLNENAKIPTYGSPDSAGLDLYASEDYIIQPGERSCVGTGLSIEWVRNNEKDEKVEQFYFRIGPRSGLAVKNGIDCMAGICDADYRGEIKVVLINHGKEDFIISKGDRIAQGILTRIERFSEISIVDDL